ncbi:glycosyltransferase family 39 protein [Rosistilla ulvae]|uniref:glycosyltransferase family 39 protein n=1 Tax=Rosistilla ulvae TaxID=1930277 RepID=UPI001C54C0CC|nr:glycosyltransferase family 39 protein [Rosistilla ulvae]
MRTGRVATWQLVLAASVVFLVALVLRLPSCFDSLWVDELHTAWTIWGDFSDVPSRARLGNQSPVYFAVLWLWHQVFGDAEVVLRLSSVLLVACSCALLVVGVYRLHRDLLLGLLAGGLLAVDRNSIFFGTELRPYAAVILLSTLLVLVCAGALDRRRFWRAIALVVTVAALFWTHYTALLVAAGVLVAFAVKQIVRQRWSGASVASVAVDALLVWSAVGIAAAVEYRAIVQLWGRRGEWEAFAVPRPLNGANSLSENLSVGFGDIGAMWPWGPAFLIPLALLVLARLAGARFRMRRWLPFVAAVVLVTLVAYGLATMKVSAVWHRRYIVGLLPVLAWGSAALWLTAIRGIFVSLRRTRFSGRYLSSTAVTLSAVLVPIVVLLFWQGTLENLLRRDLHLVHRREDWRSAVAAIDELRVVGQPVAVDAGLIEAKRWERDRGEGRGAESPMFLRYLCCPVNNIYPLREVVPLAGVSEGELLRFRQQSADRSSSDREMLWIIARVPQRRHEAVAELLQSFASRQSDRAAGGKRFEYTTRSFGGVLVIQWRVE